MEIWIDDLMINDEEFHLDDDSNFTGHGNHAEFRERVVRPFHHFGYSRTTHVNDSPGEIGGIVWRDERPSYYADRVGPLDLNNRLIASGRITFLAAAADSGVYLGWFNSEANRNKEEPEHVSRQTSYVGLLIEGPSRIGHYFRPGYAAQDGSGTNAQTGPVILPDGNVHDWQLEYDPNAADGNGAVTIIYDDHRQTLPLEAEHRRLGATFDRFGLFNMQSGGWHVEIYVDDLEYTVNP